MPRWVAAWAFGLATTLLLTGCGGAGGDSSRPMDSAIASGHDSWADEIRSASEEATTEDEKAALADGVISDQEYAYFQNKIVECLAGLGVSASWAEDRALEYTKPQSVTIERVNQCNRENGLSVIALRDAIKRNPEHVDEDELLLSCLKRVRLVHPGYTAEMLASGADLPAFVESESFAGCNADPLHYGEER